MTKTTCMALVERHLIDIDAAPKPWLASHIAGWTNPTPAEAPIKGLIVAFARTADVHGGERGLGRDGYFGPHADDMLKAMLALLNFEQGRLDCGSLDHLIRQLADNVGLKGDSL